MELAYKKTNQSKLHLVIPDVHAEPGDDLDRLSAAMNLACDHQPDHVIQIGDLGDFGAFSTHEEPGSLTDIEANEDHWADFEVMERAVGELEIYGLPTTITLGNHEDRVNRYIDKNPRCKKAYNFMANSGLKDSHIKTVPYGRHTIIDGILYTHVPMNKMGRPIGSVAGIKRFTLGAKANAVVYGHTHKFDAPHFDVEADHSLKSAINVGCLFEGHGAYMNKAAVCYWRGVTLLRVYKKGPPDIETISMNRLLSEWG